MPRRARRLSLGMVPMFCTAVLLLGLVTVAAPPAGAGTRTGQPAVGQCYDYHFAQIIKSSTRSSPVACEGRHTAVTVATVTVPGRIDLSDTDKTYAAIATTCYRAVARTLGTNVQTRALTAYSFVWFTPTAAQQRQGARWVRCDLVLLNVGALTALPTPLIGTTPLPDSIARCLAPSRGREYKSTCASSHDYRAIRAIRLAGRYKTVNAFRALASNRCPSIAGPHWFASWSYPEEWSSGTKVLVCSRRTHR